MKRGAPLGYTIVEVMVFLAVTSALFVMVAVTFQGRQARTEFFAATRDMETAIADVINDITSGYYGSPGSFTCELNPAGDELQITGNPSEQGTNSDCIFIGKAIHFGVSEPNGSERYNIMTIAGRRISGDLPNSIPKVVSSATDRKRYPVGLKYGGVRRQGGFAGDGNVAGVALLSSTNYSGSDKGFQPGALELQFIIPLPFESAASVPAASEAEMIGYVEKVSDPIYQDVASGGLYKIVAQAATSHIELCLDGTAIDRHAIYSIGTQDSSKSRGSVELRVGEGSCLDAGFSAS